MESELPKGNTVGILELLEALLHLSGSKTRFG